MVTTSINRLVSRWIMIPTMASLVPFDPYRLAEDLRLVRAQPSPFLEPLKGFDRLRTNGRAVCFLLQAAHRSAHDLGLGNTPFLRERLQGIKGGLVQGHAGAGQAVSHVVTTYTTSHSTQARSSRWPGRKTRALSSHHPAATLRLCSMPCRCARFTSLVPFLLMTAAAFGQTSSAPPAPPVAPVRPVIDDYHGTKVSDPYRYMEDLQNPEVSGWMKAQSGVTEEVLATLPGRQALARADSGAGPGAPYTIGGLQRLENGSVFYRKLEAGAETPVIASRRLAGRRGNGRPRPQNL